MYRLYLDTCIVNDTFPLIQNQVRGEIGQSDFKVPMSRWAAEYVALYHLLDLEVAQRSERPRLSEGVGDLWHLLAQG